MCCCGDPVHAHDGHERVPTLQLTHHPHPAAHTVAQSLPCGGCTLGVRLMGWPSLLLTWLDAREVSATLTLLLRAGNTERIPNPPHPRSRAETASATPHGHSRSYSLCRITDGGIPRSRGRRSSMTPPGSNGNARWRIPPLIPNVELPTFTTRFGELLQYQPG